MHAISEQNQNPQRNKTTPTLPSHSPIHSPNSTPPLTQSTSGSNYSSNSFASTSQSPPLPFTPPSRYSRTHVSSFANQRAIANRSGARYPNNLALGRTPLHRRGTSQTYEPFEDLLREAGYKETRIFTPETERTVPTDNQSNGSDGKSKVAGVVGFLSGLIPGSRSSSLQVESTEETKGSRYSPPGSPTLAARRNFGPKKEKEYHPSQESDEDATPRPLRTGGPLHLRPNDTSIHYTHNNHSYTTLSQSSSSKQMPPPLPPSHNNPPVSDSRPSRATAYLRHIASVPDIPGADLQRSQSPSESTRNRQMKRKSFNSGHYSDNDEDTDFNSAYEGRHRGNGEGEEDTNLPRQVPRTWLETVARAMLLGPTGVSSSSSSSSSTVLASRAVSQPDVKNRARQGSSPALRQLRQTRSVVSRTGSLADAPMPSLHPLHYSQHHNHSLTRTRSARSALSSRSGLPDHTNRTHWNWAATNRSPLAGVKSAAASIGPTIEVGNRPRPTLMSRLEGHSRSNASEGEIWRARVTCRSAPTSRAASPNRNGPNSASSDRLTRRKSSRGQMNRGRTMTAKGKGKAGKSKSKGRSGQTIADEPPSLSRVVIEVEADDMESLDQWFQQSPRSERWKWNHSSATRTPSQDPSSSRSERFQLSSSSLSLASSNVGEEPISEEVDDDSSENEVDLAKMLRPKPQRQQSTHSVASMRSIRSLKKLLPSPAEDIPPVPPLPPNISSGSSSQQSMRSSDFLREGGP